MRRKTVSVITLSLLLIGMLILTFNIQPVKAGIPPPLVALTIHQPEGPFLEPITPYVSFQEPDTYYYQLNTSVLVIAHVLEYFIFEHFILDGNPIDTGSARITILMDKDHTLSASFIPYGPLLPVGGKATPINIPLDKPKLQIPWIWLTTIILPLIVTVVFVKLKKKKQ